MFDVLEHIDDDRGALANIARKLKPGGKILITVPAHPWMWSGARRREPSQARYSKRAQGRLIDADAG
jgi:SAM-dependent methyltransferase